MSISGLIGMVAWFVSWTATFTVPAAQTEQLVVTEIRAHGVQLYLSLPRHSYPRDALVVVTVGMRNVSQQNVRFEQCSSDSPLRYPVAQVLDRHSQWRVDPIETRYSLCATVAHPTLRHVTLRPGQRIVEHEYRVLVRPHLRAYIALDGSRSGHFLYVATPVVTLHLMPAVAPTITFDPAREPALARVTDLDPTQPVFYRSDIECPDPAGQVVGIGYLVLLWTAVTDATITPRCTPIKRWLLEVGQVDHRAAIVEFKGAPMVQTSPRPHGSPALFP